MLGTTPRMNKTVMLCAVGIMAIITCRNIYATTYKCPQSLTVLANAAVAAPTGFSTVSGNVYTNPTNNTATLTLLGVGHSGCVSNPLASFFSCAYSTTYSGTATSSACTTANGTYISSNDSCTLSTTACPTTLPQQVSATYQSCGSASTTRATSGPCNGLTPGCTPGTMGPPQLGCKYCSNNAVATCSAVVNTVTCQVKKQTPWTPLLQVNPCNGCSGDSSSFTCN